MGWYDSAFVYLNMHDDLGDPIEQLGIEIEQDDNDTITDFKKTFGEKLLKDNGVNVTELEEADLRCGGLVFNTNMSIFLNSSYNARAAECMIQKCKFVKGGPEICPPDYKESDDTVFWIYFFLRFVVELLEFGHKLRKVGIPS